MESQPFSESTPSATGGTKVRPHQIRIDELIDAIIDQATPEQLRKLRKRLDEKGKE